MPIIRQLPPALVNKIAAGEVIERPASVVKELLENSVDAGSTRVELVVEKGGLELVRVSDNGCGISIEQLPLAIASHATSKLQNADDLFDIHTLGFRGEALASIAEISHFEMKSRARESESGAIMLVRGGEMVEPQPVGSPVGTSISVRHLFFNTPVRRKFLKSAQTEMGHVVEAFTRVALAYPQVHMVLISNDRTLYDLSPTDRWAERIGAFFGDEVAENLIHVDSEIDDIVLRGFVGDPAVSRSNNRMQYLFLNGRCIRDRALQHALGEAYRGLLMVGRFPICFLRLDMPAKMVDVNVHPTKMEVRFQDAGRIYGQLLQTLRHKFLSTDLTAKVSKTPVASTNSGEPGRDELPRETLFPSIAQDAYGAGSQATRGDQFLGTATTSPVQSYLRENRLPLNDIPPFRPFGDGLSDRGPYSGSPIRSGYGSPSALPTSTHSGHDSHSAVPPSWSPVAADSEGLSPVDNLPPGAQAWTGDVAANGVESGTAITRFDSPTSTAPVMSHLGFQVHQRYIVTQDETGMVIIDQHALHERIMYEQIRTKVLQGKLETQQLLVPEPVSLTPAEAAAALDAAVILKQVGIHVEPFGGDTVLITAYPAMLRKEKPAELLVQVLEIWMGAGKRPEPRDLLDHMLHTIACKAAIKAGDRLAAEEITELLQQRHHYQDSHHCPHGRPTALFFSREQLDKMFKRI
jgi:DNA mismatch repair protein MutL